MFCSNCGNKIVPGAAFCGACGTPVVSIPQPQQPAVEEIPAANNQKPLNPAPAYNQEPLNPTPAYHQEPLNPAPAYNQEPLNPAPAYNQEPLNPTPAYNQEPLNPAPAYNQEPLNPDPAYNQEPLNPTPAYNQEPLNPTPAYNQEPLDPTPDPEQAPVEAMPVEAMPVEATPVAQAPTPSEPAYEAPAYEQPVYQQPVYEAPAYEQPAYQQPVYQQPVYQQPVYQQPAYQPPVPEAAPVQTLPVTEKGSVVRKGRFLRKHAKGGTKVLSVLAFLLAIGVIGLLAGGLWYSVSTPVFELPQAELVMNIIGKDADELQGELQETYELMQENHEYSYDHLTSDQVKANEKTLKALEKVVDECTVLNMLDLVEVAGQYKDDLVMKEADRDDLTQGLQWLKYGLIGIAAWYVVLVLLALIAGLKKSSGVAVALMLLASLTQVLISGWFWAALTVGVSIVLIVLCACINGAYKRFLVGNYAK